MTRHALPYVTSMQNIDGFTKGSGQFAREVKRMEHIVVSHKLRMRKARGSNLSGLDVAVVACACVCVCVCVHYNLLSVC